MRKSWGKITNTRQTIRRRAETVTLFNRQMATLLEAGLPLLRALETLTRQQKRADFKAVLEEISDGIRAGQRFSDGLARFPRIFDTLSLNMVRAGEAGGVLEVVMARVALFQERSQRLRGKVQAAMIYPLIVMLVAVGIVGFLIAYVIPQFQGVFATMLRGQALPGLTQLVLDLSGFVQRAWWALLALPLGGWVALKGLRRTDFGERALDGLLLQTPVLGDWIRHLAIARFARTFGTLVTSGVPLLEALQSSQSVLGNRRIREAMDTVHDRVRAGASLAEPLAETAVFPPMVSSMIAVGEETDRLDEVCASLADTYEEEVDRTVTALTSILEPVMIVLLAVVVGTIVVALFLPIISIIQYLNTR